MNTTTSLPRRHVLRALSAIALALGALATATVPARAAEGNFSMWSCYIIFEGGEQTTPPSTPNASWAYGDSSRFGQSIPFMGTQGGQSIAHSLSFQTIADQVWNFSEYSSQGENFTNPYSLVSFSENKKFKIRFVRGSKTPVGDIPQSAEIQFSAVSTNLFTFSQGSRGMQNSGSTVSFIQLAQLNPMGPILETNLFNYNHNLNSSGYGGSNSIQKSQISPPMRVRVNPVGRVRGGGTNTYETDFIRLEATQTSSGTLWMNFVSENPQIIGGTGTGHEYGDLIAGLVAAPDKRLADIGPTSAL
jgi:hypothetical protein